MRPQSTSGAALARAAAPDARRGVAERGVCERVQRLGEVAQLASDQCEALVLLGAAVRSLQLGRDPVEPLEQRVELTVTDLFRFHERILRGNGPKLVAVPHDDGFRPKE
jgi:hypothetical protein